MGNIAHDLLRMWPKRGLKRFHRIELSNIRVKSSYGFVSNHGFAPAPRGFRFAPAAQTTYTVSQGWWHLSYEYPTRGIL